MALFSVVIPVIIRTEGGYVNDKSDYGGETKYGISSKQYPKVDIKNLTVDTAMSIIEDDYWTPHYLDKILSQEIANQCLLLIMNMNPFNAIKIIQRAINENTRNILTVTIDGIMGVKTIDTINSTNPFYLMNSIKIQSCIYYLQLTDNDKTQIPNFRGWIRRVLV